MATRLPETSEMTCEALVRLDSNLEVLWMRREPNPPGKCLLAPSESVRTRICHLQAGWAYDDCHLGAGGLGPIG